MRKTLAVAIAGLAMLGTTAAPASAVAPSTVTSVASIDPHGPEAQAREQALVDLMADLNARGASWAEWTAALEAEGITDLPAVEPRGEVQTLSSGNAVEVSVFRAFDSQRAVFTITGRYEWLNRSWEGDAPATCNIGASTPCEIGGVDAMSLQTQNPVEIAATAASFTFSDGTTGVAESAPTTLNSTGATWQKQDVISRGEYSMARGVSSISIPEGGGVTGNQFFFGYAHTWAETSVTGVSAGSGGITFSFSSTAAQFQRAASTT